MAYEHHKEPLMPSDSNFNTTISFPSIFSLTVSTGALLFADYLLSSSSQNPQNSIINLLIPLLLFSLVLTTFLLGTGLLIIRAVVASNSSHGEIYAVQISQMAKITTNLALVCVFAEVVIGIYLVLPEAIAA